MNDPRPVVEGCRVQVLHYKGKKGSAHGTFVRFWTTKRSGVRLAKVLIDGCRGASVFKADRIVPAEEACHVD